jgi:hypothetical protein
MGRQSRWHDQAGVPPIRSSLPAPVELAAARIAVVAPDVLRQVADQAATESHTDARFLGDYLETLLQAARSTRRFNSVEMDSASRSGVTAAEAGIPLGALVDLYLSATWRLWHEISQDTSAGQTGALAALAEAFFRGADDAVASVTQGYDEEQRLAIRREEAIRREFVDDLLSGGNQPDALLTPATRFGFNLSGPHLVAVCKTHRPITDTGPVHARLEREILARYPGGSCLVTSKGGLLVIVLPGEEVDPTLDLPAILDKTGEAPWLIGLGAAHRGPGGVASSFREAGETLDLCERLGFEGPLVSHDTLATYRILLRDPAALAGLVEEVLGNLASARGGAEPLVETLEVFFSESGNVAAAARRLHLSTRGMFHRLGTIERLTGYSPRDPEQRFLLELALRGRRLLT